MAFPLIRLLSVKLFLLTVFVIFTFQSNAQTCAGSLGDPVINQDFGSGPGQGAELAPGITNMTYVSSNCPNDGQYTISNSIAGSGNCHNSWHNVQTDHTGNPNGYMMIINASPQPSIFFRQSANGLCPNTTYEFSSYILNLITLAASGPGVSEPSIKFSIATASGQILAVDSTGTIPPTSTPSWNKYGVYFTTPANVTDVVVTMTNNAPGGNGNDLILDDITFRACGPIIQSGFASIAGPADEDLCEGSSAVFTLIAKVTGNNNPAFQWQSNTNAYGWLDIPGGTENRINIPFNNAVIGVYQYRLGVSNGSNISSVSCRVYSSPLTVNVPTPPVVPAIPNQTVCEGTTLQISASGGTTYVWSGPDNVKTTQNPLIINDFSQANAGTYTVQAISAVGCYSLPVHTFVTMLPKPVVSVSKGIAVCRGESAQLSASGGLYYKWTPSAGLNNDDIPNPIATPSHTTTYTVSVSNQTCTDSSKHITITVNQIPVAIAGSNKNIFEGQSVRLNGSILGNEIVSVYWTPATSLDDPTLLMPIANPKNDITYTFHAVSENCGIATSTMSVKVYKKITIPNTFSPNNDGVNDHWDIDALIAFPESSMLIYNRYGQQVYESTGYAIPWNGTYNGSPLPVGTYYYIIDLKNNTPRLTGWVLIVK